MGEKLEVKSAVKTYIAFQFFFQMMIWLPIFYEYQIRIGLSPAQIFEIQSYYYIAFCLLEIPTGLIADRLGYLRCLRAGAVVLVIANILPLSNASYVGMLLHFMGIALSRSLISGASSAYLYDYLNERGEAAQYKTVEGHARSYGLIGKVIAWAAIGALMKWEITLPYSLTAFSALVSVFYAIKLPGLKPLEIQTRPAIYEHIGMALKTVAVRPLLLLIMLQGVGLFVLGRIVQVNLFQPILSTHSFDVATFGIVMSIMTGFEALGSHWPHLLRKYVGDLNA
ncbi:MAG: MFS transporter, partial [Proteobacteria bacterium]